MGSSLFKTTLVEPMLRENAKLTAFLDTLKVEASFGNISFSYWFIR
jgi:hypothetical protein